MKQKGTESFKMDTQSYTWPQELIAESLANCSHHLWSLGSTAHSSDSSMEGAVPELFSISTISSGNLRVKALCLLLVSVYVYRILCFILLNWSTSLSAVLVVPTLRET